MNEPTQDDLEYGVAEARWAWEEAARVMALHRELASMYRNKSRDKRTIAILWEQIEAGEFSLRAAGIYL